MESNGRDGQGRFVKGWKGGPGNPALTHQAHLRQSMLETVTPDQVRAVYEALRVAALEGDVQAAKLWLAYAVAEPPKSKEEDAGRPEIDLARFVAILLDLVGDTPDGRKKTAQALRQLLAPVHSVGSDAVTDTDGD